MPVSVAASGSQTCTVDTTHTLTTTAGPSGGGAYMLRIDTNALAGSELLEVTLQSRARAADTTRPCWTDTFSADSIPKVQLSPLVPVESGNEVVATIRQRNGTGRAILWALVRVDG